MLKKINLFCLVLILSSNANKSMDTKEYDLINGAGKSRKIEISYDTKSRILIFRLYNRGNILDSNIINDIKYFSFSDLKIDKAAEPLFKTESENKSTPKTHANLYFVSKKGDMLIKEQGFLYINDQDKIVLESTDITNTYFASIENSSGRKDSLIINYNIPESELTIIQINEGRNSDSLVYSRVMDFDSGHFTIERNKFLKFFYEWNIGSNTEAICTAYLATSNNRLVESLHLISHCSFNIDTYWDKNAPEVSVHNTNDLYFEFNPNSYDLLVNEKIENDSSNIKKHIAKTYIFNYDSDRCIFSTNNNSNVNNKYSIELSEDSYQFKSGRWQIKNVFGEYELF